MSLSEDIVKEKAVNTPERYAVRVRWLAIIYFVLDLLAVAVIVIIAWRVRYFVALSQRSNVETLTVAIIFVLAVYYIFLTFRGFVGALRILWLNTIGGSGDKERRKQSALKVGDNGGVKYICFDKAVRLEGKPNDVIKWDVGDADGKLGELVLDGVKLLYKPENSGVNYALFEFVDKQLEKIMKRRDPDADLQITQWSSIDEDEASAYFSMVRAFHNLEEQLGKGPVWPTIHITEADQEAIGKELRKLVPSLRNEALLPDVEFAVEYNVPIMPEPLGFLKLTRNENRADPVFTMGCAGAVLLVAMLALTFFILLPPWLPAR